MRRRRGPAEGLRNAIDAMPHRSRLAMLQGIDENPIIVGAYVDRHGGVCPMLAAHRYGGRTSLASFARAWDRYTKAKRPRRATPRELMTLRTMLEASLADDVDVDDRDMADAVAQHKLAKVRRAGAIADRDRRDESDSGTPETGERDRTAELRHRHGWAWTRLFRRYDHFQATLERIEEAQVESSADARRPRERDRV